MTEIKRVGVVGAGQMGNGIAQVAAVAGYDVVMSDVRQEALDKGLATIERSLGKLVDKERISADLRDAALSRISLTTELATFAQTDLVVEAVVESLAVKESVFRQLDEAAPEPQLLVRAHDVYLQ